MTHDQIKEQAVERIYLFPGESDGETTLLWGDDPAPGEGMDPAEAVEYVRKDVHQAIIKRQASAAKAGMDAAKRHGSHMESEAKRLHAECNPEALESEREANAKLTELVAELERERDMHKAAEEAQIALRQKADEREAALAAHVERLRERLAMCRHHACYSIGDSEALAMQLASIRNVANEALRVEPEISLARRDLIKQAEALEEICSCGELLSNRDILGMAQGLRQQADAL